MTIGQALLYGRPCSSPVPVEDRPEWFKRCCEFVCKGFSVDDGNRKIINELFLYMEKRSNRLDPEKGILLHGSIGSGKSTIMHILNRYSYFTSGRNIGDYPIGGFRIDSASHVANAYTVKGNGSLEPYTYNSGKPRTICFDELGREPMPAKYFGTELNVMQYVFQCRYEFRREALTHATTNMEPNEIKDKYGSYIADRVNEMFNVINLDRRKSRR